MNQSAPPRSHDQATRWAMYGSNAVVAVVAVVVITVLLNVLGAWKLDGRDFRLDVTGAGRYSLSPQSVKVLEKIKDPVRLVSLLPLYKTADELEREAESVSKEVGGALVKAAEEARRMERVIALLDNYARTSKQVAVEHINPLKPEPGQVERFYQALTDRYQGPVEALRSRLDPVKAMLERTRRGNQEQLQAVMAALGDPTLPTGLVRANVEGLRRIVAQSGQELAHFFEQYEAALAASMPRYGKVLSDMRSALEQGPGLTKAAEAVEMFCQGENVPATVKERLLGVAAWMKGVARDMEKAEADLAEAQPVAAYEELSSQLSGGPAVVVMHGQGARVLSLDSLFLPNDREGRGAAADQRRAEALFRGEEVITGTLMAMTMAKPPTVVFISGGQGSVRARGMYSHVADRVEKAGLKVVEWRAAGQRNPQFGIDMPGEPPPVIEPGTRAVWVLFDAGGGMMGGDAKPLEHVRQRLAEGDSALVISEGGSMFPGMPSSVDLARDWGLQVDTGKIVVTRYVPPDGRTLFNPQHLATRWPDQAGKSVAVTQALGGLQGVFAYANPMDISAPAPGVQVWPLAVLEGSGPYWAIAPPPPRSNPVMEFKDEDARSSFVVAAAAQKGKARLVVIADPVFPRDEATTFGLATADSPDRAYTVFPANTEVTVNSVIWLAGLEDWIAASARIQEVRRLRHDLTPGQRIGMGAWMAGAILALSVAGGLGVWTIRRRG